MPCEKCGFALKKNSKICPNCKTLVGIKKNSTEQAVSRGKIIKEGELYARSSIVYGIMSIFVVIAGVIIGIVSIYFGIKGYKRLKSVDKPVKFAVIGIVIGSFGFILWVYLLIFALPGFLETIRNSNY